MLRYLCCFCNILEKDNDIIELHDINKSHSGTHSIQVDDNNTSKPTVSLHDISNNLVEHINDDSLESSDDTSVGSDYFASNWREIKL